MNDKSNTPAEAPPLSDLPFFRGAPGDAQNDGAQADGAQTEAAPAQPAQSAGAANLARAAEHLTRAGQRSSRRSPDAAAPTAAPAPAPAASEPAPDTNPIRVQSVPASGSEWLAFAPHELLPSTRTVEPGPPGEPSALARPGASEGWKGSLEERSRLPWDEIDAITDEVSRALSQRLTDEPNLPESQRVAIATEHIDDLIRTRVDAQTRAGDGVHSRWPARFQQAIRQAVLDAIFRLGRLQPLVDEDGVENIHINGFDDVWLSYADGRVVRHEYPVAESDEDLTRHINMLATRSGEGARSFTSASPRLHLDLPGGARLAAVAAPVAVRPTIVLRIHRLVDVTLDDLVERDTITRDAADFLAAAVRAGVSIVTSGFPGAGKTTLLRALADCIPADEKLVTIEMERELYLDKIPLRHPRVTSLEYRPGGGEPLSDGRLPGEITLEDLVYDTLRLDTQRFVVGEVRGPEIYAMMQAMQSGVGSLSTLHAASADDSIDRMSALMLSRGHNSTPTYAYRMIEQNIRLVVQIAKMTDPVTKRPRRAVTEIAEILPGESSNDGRPVASLVYRFDKRLRHLVRDTLPSPQLMETLHDVGYDGAGLRGGE
ncbi:CpaF family protein [Microbacterium paludicola]|uniref:CpaF family protein n=1 Tax=Microbacterium paludicola TaxID=300019 RepID=UPI003879E433